MWCCLFLIILQNEIQDFLVSFELCSLESEKVKPVTTLRNLNYLATHFFQSFTMVS